MLKKDLLEILHKYKLIRKNKVYIFELKHYLKIENIDFKTSFNKYLMQDNINIIDNEKLMLEYIKQAKNIDFLTISILPCFYDFNSYILKKFNMQDIFSYNTFSKYFQNCLKIENLESNIDIDHNSFLKDKIATNFYNQIEKKQALIENLDNIFVQLSSSLEINPNMYGRMIQILDIKNKINNEIDLIKKEALNFYGEVDALKEQNPSKGSDMNLLNAWQAFFDNKEEEGKVYNEPNIFNN
jgi:hypothetical protein